MTDQDTQYSARMGRRMWLAVWIILLAMLTLFFDDILDEQRNPNQVINSQVNASGITEIVLERNRAGHYIASGFINEQPVEFMLDTGASDVAIPEHIARQLNLVPGPPIHYQTANGTVRGYRTNLDAVKLGAIEVRDVAGGINPGMQQDVVLLGMSFLKHVEFTQRGNELTIRPLPF